MKNLLMVAVGMAFIGFLSNAWGIDESSPSLFKSQASGLASGKRQHKPLSAQRKAGGTQMTTHDKAQLTKQLSGTTGAGAGKNKADLYVKGGAAQGTGKVPLKADTWVKGGITDGSMNGKAKVDQSFIKMDNGMQKTGPAGGPAALPAIQTNH
jgi:hypothetical protein